MLAQCQEDLTPYHVWKASAIENFRFFCYPNQSIHVSGETAMSETNTNILQKKMHMQQYKDSMYILPFLRLPMQWKGQLIVNPQYPYTVNVM